MQSGQYFQGDIDEVRVWRTARSAADIQQDMCRKFATAPADLVAYYRFDQSSGLAATDEGSQPTTGTLVGFSGTPWHVSGAALGDASTSLYQTSLAAGARVALATASGDSAVASLLSTQTRGVQLYAVNSPPSIAAGAGAAANYVGVFTVGTGNIPTFSLRLHPLGGASCRAAQQRPANDQGWAALATATVNNSLLSSSLNYRGEYILLGSSPPPLTISGDSLVCTGATGQLTAAAAGATGYRWSTGATTATLSNLAPGTYTVTASFANGCTTTAQVRVRALALPTVVIGGDSVLCPGATAQLATFVGNAVSPLTYRWSTGATTAGLAVTQAGTYSVTVTNATGCAQQASYRVRGALATPTFTLGADTTLCDGEALTLRGPTGAGLRYLWSDGSTNQQLTVTAAGSYSLRVSSQCGTTQAARAVAARNCLLVPNIITPNNDAHNDRFVVQGLVGSDWSLDVYNRWGHAVLHTDSYRNDWGAEAAPGIYYVLLRRASTGYRYQGWVEVVR